MKGFVYKWVNNLNKKWYIGSHKGTPNDGYTASGIAISAAFEKYGIENFTRYIIHEGDDYRLVEELSLLSHDAANNHMSYNMKNGAVGGDTSRYVDYKNRYTQSGDNHWTNRVGQAEETRSKISKTLKEMSKDGRNLSEEARKKMSEAGRKPKSTEHIAKMNRIVNCPHCSKSGNVRLMKRYHFNNCKNKE